MSRAGRWSRTLLFTAVCVAVLTCADVAAAQLGQGGVPPVPGYTFQERFEEQLTLYKLERQTGEWREAHSPRRVRRAEQAARMINSGDCDGAAAFARAQGDTRMVVRIQQVCSDITVGEPVPVNR